MELIGLIIKKYNNISWNEPIVFNSNYTIEWRNRNLKVNKVEDSVPNFYGDNISNITAIVGNNGREDNYFGSDWVYQRGEKLPCF